MADLRRILDSRGADAVAALSESAGAAAPVDPLLDPNACEECEDRLAAHICIECQGRFCELCLRQLHRKGRRARHCFEAFQPSGGAPAAQVAQQQVEAAAGRRSMRERSRFIPLRLAYEERKLLRTVEAALRASDYVTAVDQAFPSEAKRRHAQLRGICAFLCGLVTCVNYDAGQRLLEERCFADFEEFFQECTEILRRYKIMNPEKLRGEYGKLLYMMEDAMTGQVRQLLGFDLKGDVKTVYKELEALDALRLLDDPLVEVATQEILPDRAKARSEIQAEIKRKNRAVELLAKRYAGSTRGEVAERIRLCLYSIADNNSFLNANRLPVDKMILMLDRRFKAGAVEDGYSLAIQEGLKGARLSHSHDRQFHYVRQSLKLWSEILNDFFRLWYLAEEDLLSGATPYSLEDTGQGFQRVQQCPNTFRAMQEILFTVMEGVSWVGSSVVHLGDRNVPNALVFIDKYTQISRILGPVVNTLEQIRRIYDEDPATQVLIDSGFGGLDKAEKDVLYDFFRYAFDGSGADNFVEAGSCIDGRLTSAWNWCSNIGSKPYLPLFHLTGNQGFDGDFQR
mmetsp:Transcript_39247/g.122837  ORF Transcript_39247/g.122837 Transcript_39247/m.122837 type:complete len:569 (-) Transcript_39247:216-1922(-)